MGVENNDRCSQRDSAEREGYVREHRSFNRIWKERDSAEPDIQSWLEEDKRHWRKQHHTAQRVYERLVEEHGYTGSYSVVQRHLKMPDATGRKGKPGAWGLRRLILAKQIFMRQGKPAERNI